MDNWIDAARLTVIVGHFGSGKTEFAVNMAMALADKGHPFALADLDVVDPYFRSRECRDMIEERGGRLIASSQMHVDADLPSMPPDVFALFDNPELYGILDIGGDPSGARVLARYRHDLQRCGARVLCVVNANRPLSDTAEKAERYVRAIEQSSGLKIDGLINNTHCCQLTDVEDVVAGAKMAQEVSVLTGIPVVCHAVPLHLADRVSDLVYPVFPMQLYMKKPWE
ncbi:hypothetical protein CJ260_04120 [Megasphaera sp. ASD88]|uniref:hypothetical protein n=1 Tax=Megasphaera TaxID=906 RepID=UPI000BABFFF0|nr:MULTISPECIES: hypothetical protein [Megasphaera]PAV39373.1 hypothetical protein CJ260_04120 [Megasphaera sp. ASD88]HJE81927.1 hypothetical protein [Megasphaera stantonii]